MLSRLHAPRMAPWRIGVLFEYSTLNGGERSILAAIDWLRANDNRFEFVAIGPSTGRLADAILERGITLDDWSTAGDSGQRLSNDAAVEKLRTIVNPLRLDLLHANSLAMGRYSGRLAESADIPTTTHLRDIIKLSSAVRGDLNQNRKLIAVSHFTRDFHVAQGLQSSRVVVIHNGVDLDEFQPRVASGWLISQMAERIESFATRNVIQTPKLIVTIGQIGLRKGQDILAAAAPMIVDQIPDAHFLIVGERTSGKQESIEFERSIPRLFADGGLSERLHLLGHRDDVARLLNEVDLLLHPANQEPYGRVLLEATAAGVPIVATEVGGTAEIVVDGITGLLVPPKDSQALARAVIQIFTDEQMALRFRSAARQRAVQHLSIGTSAKLLGDLWAEILNQQAPRRPESEPA